MALKTRLRGPIRRTMEILGVPPGVRPHLQDRLLRSSMARMKSLPRAGRMWAGTEIYWLRPGLADIGILELPAPGPDDILVRSDFTAVSPGTERALLNLLPGISATFPLRPGYSGSGTVVAVGKRVDGVRPGMRVACAEMIQHASMALVRASRAFEIPAGVRAEDAAFLHILVIAQQGVRKGRIAPGDSVTIVGAGLIAQMAAQLARAAGARTVTVVAATGAKRDLSLRLGASAFIDLGRDARLVDTLGSAVVIDVTGSPDALATAVRAAAPGGRVVLLGSTRGVNARVDFDALVRRKELTLIGAHISTVTDEPTSGDRWSYGDEARAALAALATRAVALEPLVTDRLDPRAAAVFYRRLCRGDRDIVGALFEWNRLADAERCRRSFALVPPRDMFRKGRAFDQNDGAPSVIERPLPALAAGIEALPASRGVLRFGLIGCGGMGVKHAGAIRSAANAALVATMDLDAKLAADVAAGAFSTTRVEELLARPDVDAVVIVTPNHLHDTIGIQAARAGKHVIVEKPIAQDLAHADRLVTACREAGVALSVGYSFRYAPEVRAARRLVDEGRIGRILSVQLACYFDRPPSYYGSGCTNRTHSDWRASREKAGGGVLIMNMSHQLDQIRYIVGEDVARVTAVSGSVDMPVGVEVEDVVSVACEFEGGAVGSFFGTCCARGLENQIEIRIVGESGSIVLDRECRFYTLTAMPGVVPGRWHGFGELPKVDVHTAYVAWFADAVLSGRTPEISGDDGRALQAWMEAVYESARLGRSVALSTPPIAVMRGSAA